MFGAIRLLPLCLIGNQGNRNREDWDNRPGPVGSTHRSTKTERVGFARVNLLRYPASSSFPLVLP